MITISGLPLCDQAATNGMTPLEQFLRDATDIHSSHSAVDETSYYGAIESLFNEIGKNLKPRVRCILHPKNTGAGLPDGGLFTAEQFDKKPNAGKAAREGQLPARGAIEVKPPKDDAKSIAVSDQATRYLSRYRQLLVTNLRQFVLVGHDLDGNPTILESYDLADSEANFWKTAAHPRKAEEFHGTRFGEYLKRVMLHAAPLVAPEDVAFFLASYARDALARIERVELDALAAVRSALEEALGLRFEGQKGEHFFRSSLVQTLFYGVFSAWVLWSRKYPPPSKNRFDWNATARLLKVPVIRKLFHEVAEPGQLQTLKLDEVLDWTAAVLNRVDRTQFFASFEESQAVQYFYEPFLEEFDPELRKQLGVWYTPHEIVEYMVARVDRALREQLGITDGLADRNVYVLDPCCGTGSFLVEVLRKIHATLKERSGDALIASDLQEAVTSRVFGFELLPAPFVVSHLQIGLLLDKLGMPFSERGIERAGVYLTNALTGWEPPKGPKQHLIFSELEEERDAAEHVKRETPILVIIGNPPYNGFAGVAVEEERALTTAYRTAKKAPRPQGQGLNDLYVRFYRMAERRIVEMSGYGVVCLISNYSWLDGRSFTGMRENYLDRFDGIWIDCLNGDKYKTGKVTPEGEPDPSVFSTPWNREGIQVGTAIGLLVRKRAHAATESIGFKHFWGQRKRQQLIESLPGAKYTALAPIAELGFPFMPAITAKGYEAWPLLTELFPTFFPGVKTSRDRLLIDLDKTVLTQRMLSFFDPKLSYKEWQEKNPGLADKRDRFNPETVRDYLVRRGFKSEYILRYQYRPFDVRWVYWEPETKLLDEKRSEYFRQVAPGNIWLTAGQRNRKDEFYQPQFTRVLADHHVVESNTGMFPLMVLPNQSVAPLYHSGQNSFQPNLTDVTRDLVGRLGTDPEDIFYSALATLSSPQYRSENSGALRQDWPRVPLPDSGRLLKASAQLGREMATLFDTESSVEGVNAGEIRAELKLLGPITRVGGGNLKNSDLALTAGWGHAGDGGVSMPGRGKLVKRDYSQAEREAIASGAKRLGLSLEQVFLLLGPKTSDVYINDVAYWANVPLNVWDYSIGGYQVIKKWLSYREQKILGRTLTNPEVRYLQETIRRIATIILLGPVLDSNYDAIKSAPFSFNPAIPQACHLP